VSALPLSIPPHRTLTVPSRRDVCQAIISCHVKVVNRTCHFSIHIRTCREFKIPRTTVVRVRFDSCRSLLWSISAVRLFLQHYRFWDGYGTWSDHCIYGKGCALFAFPGVFLVFISPLMWWLVSDVAHLMTVSIMRCSKDCYSKDDDMLC